MILPLEPLGLFYGHHLGYHYFRQHLHGISISTILFFQWDLDHLRYSRAAAPKHNRGTEPTKVCDAWLNFNLFLQNKAQSMAWWLNCFISVFQRHSLGIAPLHIDCTKFEHDPPTIHWWKGLLHPKLFVQREQTLSKAGVFERQILQMIGHVPMKWGHLGCFTPNMKTIHSM